MANQAWKGGLATIIIATLFALIHGSFFHNIAPEKLFIILIGIIFICVALIGLSIYLYDNFTTRKIPFYDHIITAVYLLRYSLSHSVIKRRHIIKNIVNILINTKVNNYLDPKTYIKKHYYLIKLLKRYLINTDNEIRATIILGIISKFNNINLLKLVNNYIGNIIIDIATKESNIIVTLLCLDYLFLLEDNVNLKIIYGNNFIIKQENNPVLNRIEVYLWLSQQENLNKNIICRIPIHSQQPNTPGYIDFIIPAKEALSIINETIRSRVNNIDYINSYFDCYLIKTTHKYLITKRYALFRILEYNKTAYYHKKLVNENSSALSYYCKFNYDINSYYCGICRQEYANINYSSEIEMSGISGIGSEGTYHYRYPFERTIMQCPQGHPIEL